MIGLLTTKEIDFFTKLAELLKEYSAIVQATGLPEEEIKAL